MKKKLALALAGLFGALLVAAVAAVLLVPDAFGGFATAGELEGSWADAKGVTLTLRQDGTLTAVDLPTEFSIEDNSPTERFTGNGQWILEKKPGLGDQEIELTLDHADGSKSGMRMMVLGAKARDGIYVPISEDSPDRYVLRKSS